MINSNLPKRLNQFLNYIKNVESKSLKTHDGYKIDLTMMFRFILSQRSNIDAQNMKDIDISGIDDEFIKSIEFVELSEFISFLTNKGNGISDKRRKISAMQKFFKYMVKIAKVISESDNPSTDLPSLKLNPKEMVYLNEGEIKNLMETIDDRIDKNNAIRDKCIVTFFLNSGMRISELIGINIDDIKGNEVFITGKGNKQRKFFLNNQCVTTLNEWLKVRNDMGISKDEKALFISQKKNRISKGAVGNITKKYASLSDIEKKFTTHKYRHSVATLMLKKGVDIKTLAKVLGHASIATTQIYTHTNDEQLQSAFNILDN